MKAAQITQYSKNIHITVNDIPIPEIGDYDILIRIKAAAVNLVDILNLSNEIGSQRTYKRESDYTFPRPGKKLNDGIYLNRTWRFEKSNRRFLMTTMWQWGSCIYC